MNRDLIFNLADELFGQHRDFFLVAFTLLWHIFSPGSINNLNPFANFFFNSNKKILIMSSPFFLVIPSDIEYVDSDEDSNTTRSTQSNTNRKKWKSNITTNRSNKSHTSFFFRIDENNSELVYCKICELNLSGTHKKPYAYTRKGGNTSSMIAHLRDKHNITKDNYTQYLDEYKEVRLWI